MRPRRERGGPLIRKTRLAAGLAASVVHALTLLASLPAPVAAVDAPAYVSRSNELRASVGLGPVSLSALAEQISAERAGQLALADVAAHDRSYIKARLDAAGVCYLNFGELVAWDAAGTPYDARTTVEEWWASSDHHAVMVGDFDAAGGSHSTSPVSGTTYAVMVFIQHCDGPTTFTRLAGADRYATAAALSQSRFSTATTVFVATGAAFPDALAGAPAAARANAPILLTARDGLPAATANELARLRPSTVVVLGGPGAVGEGVVAQLRGYSPSVVRWWGTNRFETAAAISRNTFGAGVSTAYVAIGRSFPDALSGGGVAGRDGGPILLVDRDAIPAATATELARLRPGRIVVLGGPGPVSDGVVAGLAGYSTSGSVSRLAGADRYATSVAISQAAYGAGGSDAAFVATGTNFPDGLSGGPVAALVPGPLLLVSPTQLPGSVAAELQRLAPDTVYVIGGTGAVSNGVVNAMDAVLP